MKTTTAVLFIGFIALPTSAQERLATSSQSRSGNPITFATSEKAPAGFNAWAFKWTAPRRETNATLECIVLNPEGRDYFRGHVGGAPPGHAQRMDFMHGFAGGDPSVFHGQHVRVTFRSKGGKCDFDPLAKYSFEFRKVRPLEPPRQGHFSGPINAALTSVQKKVFVVPTHEVDSAAQAAIHAFVRQARDFFAKDASVITDEEALKLSLTNEVVMVYGTWSGNAWLARSLASHPVKIERERLVGGREFPGMDLRFISAWPNPKNPQIGCVIYTAQQARDIPEINAVFHGPTDYVVARGRQGLKAGFYSKAATRWSYPPDDGATDESYGVVISQIQAVVKTD